ncbi:MAG: NAD(+) synthase [Candidatus Rifleibacteriota bacterium]
MKKSFYSPYSHGFFRCAAATPYVKLADPAFNLRAHLELAEEAAKNSAGLIVFPELGLSGYSLQDIFHQKTLLTSIEEALEKLVEESQNIFSMMVVGLPLLLDGRLFNCAAVIHRGQLLGFVPKTFLPNYREFYEKRHFSSAEEITVDEINFGGTIVPVGTDLIFKCRNIPEAQIGIEICEDLWAPITPATFATMAGATIIGNLSASNVVIGKADYRRLIVRSFSGKNICGYIYSSAGQGESTTDLAWDGHAIIAENAAIVKENERFLSSGSLCIADIDVERLALERIRYNSFRDAATIWKDKTRNFRTIWFDLQELPLELDLQREVSRFPFVPDDPAVRSERCHEIFNIQVQGLSTRMKASGIKKLVIGVSGGLDSTHALIVACKAADNLGLDRKNVIACTMPGFATSKGTKKSAHELMQCLGVTALEIDIIPSCTQMLKDLQHPFANGQRIYDVTFENVQAGERTSHLFRLANFHNAMVVGTGDLSELALGWCTYGVGDHMSHYNVNASVPKTLIQYLIRWVADTAQIGEGLSSVLYRVLQTEISPELIPSESDKERLQATQDFTGPYELQDFNLYYLTRFGFKPSKVAYLCFNAWKQADSDKYDLEAIKKWLKVFVRKFYGQTQFKRSCMPDSPKVGSGGSLSPRGDWRAPSDLSADLWLEEIDEMVP